MIIYVYYGDIHELPRLELGVCRVGFRAHWILLQEGLYCGLFAGPSHLPRVGPFQSHDPIAAVRDVNPVWLCLNAIID